MSRSERRPTFSIVTAVYNVAEYLDDFIQSIEAQTWPMEDLEIIAVDDGSTDASLRRLRAWERSRPGIVQVLTQENRGQADARSLGLGYVRGRWVTFPDPDDVLRPSYLAEVAAFIDANPTVSMVATRFFILDGVTGAVTDSHPLRRRFEDGSSLRNLRSHPQFFHGSAPAAFFRREQIEQHELRFDPRVRPNWEDGHFTARYLLTFSDPEVGFVADAHYLYRKRRDQSSTLQVSFSDPGRFTSVLEHGFLDALADGARGSGDAIPPEWLQNLVLYELSWYLSSYEKHAGTPTAAVGPVAARFHDLMGQVLAFIDADVIRRFSIRRLKPVWVDVLTHGYADTAWLQEHVLVSRPDADQGLIRLSYRYRGAPPREEITTDGERVDPVHSKVRSIEYHGRALLSERIAWVPSDSALVVSLDGRARDLRTPREERENLPASGGARSLGSTRSTPERSVPWADRVVRRLARTRIMRRAFRDAWVLVDRVWDAGDNAERLFEHLRVREPRVNAWFAIGSDSADWARLRRTHGRRVLAYGSLRWKLAMANARHLVSSHADASIVKPPELRNIRHQWRFTFLQHGVIKDDLSGWLNPKPIDLFVTSTPGEQASIVGDHTPYVFSTKEVRLTGLPRFDRLRELGAGVLPDARDLVLVAPTWRVGLLRPLRAGERRRDLVPEFLQSRFVKNWMAFLSSRELAERCSERGLIIGLLLHPELERSLTLLPLPDHVRPFTYAGNDVQRLLARCALLVTDYSSMAFNAAYIDRPVVYFQFDADDVGAGAHLGRRGYFDYRRDGFGPVVGSASDAVRSVGRLLAGDPSTERTYRDRIDAAFPLRDGQCCARVVREIDRLTMHHASSGQRATA